MKHWAGPLAFLTTLSVISGYLLSKASLVGRVGMSLVYREYNFLKTWWKGGLLVFFVLTALLAVQGRLQKSLPPKQGKMMHLLALLLAFTGLYFTYNDFRHTLSHRLLGERFHIGAYLFWMGWIAISSYYLLYRKNNDFAIRSALPGEGNAEAGAKPREQF